MKLALAQIRVDGTPEANVDRAVEAIADAGAEGADLVVLPEIFNLGYFNFDRYRSGAEALDGPTLSRVREAGRAAGVAVLAGSIVEDLSTSAFGPDDGLANTSVLFDADGTRLTTYRKRHLFGYDSAEADLLTPGNRLGVAELGEFTVGMTTCYDLRFPELYRELADAGVTLVCVPSAWPYPRVEHWETLARSRAIENLSYVATTNGAGTFGESTLLGRSTVFDPWGTTLASSSDEPTLVTATLDPERVDRVRSSFPALRDRR